jgi:RNA polymerase sigma-70 factor (ECF subfamily)
MRELSEAALIELVRKRDSDALGTLYDRYGQAVYSLFLRTCRRPATAQDLTQELFLRVWNRAQYFDPQKGSLGVWILSVARNMAIDHIRSAESRFSSKLRSMEEADFRLEAKAVGVPADTAIDDVRTVRAAFSYLNQKQKQVLELAYFEGMSQSEIAAKLSEPLGTVKSWMRSGLMRMREAIQSGGAK